MSLSTEDRGVGLHPREAEALPISFVSVEGNWNPATNEARVDFAARCYWKTNATFIIASGTREPGAAVGDAPFLGAQNAQRLHEVHGIPQELIIPLHRFPFEFTYTTIEAFGNACIIGWLACGLTKLQQSAKVTFAPITLGAHRERVRVLNVRACQALHPLGVAVEVTSHADAAFNDPPHMHESERRKLEDLRRVGGLLETGIWFHGEEQRCLDDVALMSENFDRFLASAFHWMSRDLRLRLACERRVSNRFVLLQAASLRCNSGRLCVAGAERIYERTRSKFGTGLGCDPEVLLPLLHQ